MPAIPGTPLTGRKSGSVEKRNHRHSHAQYRAINSFSVPFVPGSRCAPRERSRNPIDVIRGPDAKVESLHRVHQYHEVHPNCCTNLPLPLPLQRISSIPAARHPQRGTPAGCRLPIPANDQYTRSRPQTALVPGSRVSTVSCLLSPIPHVHLIPGIPDCGLSPVATYGSRRLRPSARVPAMALLTVG